MREDACKFSVIVLLLVCVVFNTSQAADTSHSGSSNAAGMDSADNKDQISISGKVKAGSVNNEVHIRINNNSEKTVTGIKAKITKSPDFVSNFQIKPKEIDLIAPNNFGEFTVHFDVSKDAQPGETLLVNFILSTEIGELEDTEPEMLLIVEEEVVAASGTPILKLVNITGPSSAGGDGSAKIIYDYKAKQSGYTAKIVSAGRTKWVLGIAVTYAPLQIIPGKPFHIEVEARQNIFSEYPPDCDRERTPPTKADYHWVSRGYGGAGRFAPGVSIEAFPFKGWARSKEQSGCGDGVVKLTLHLVPEKHEYDNTYKKWVSNYTWRVESNDRDAYGTNNMGGGNENKPRELFRYPEKDYQIKLDIEVLPRRDLTFTSPLTLHYRTIGQGETAMVSLPTFVFSPELTQPPPGGTGDTSVAEGEGRGAGTGTGTSTGTGTVTATGVGIGTATGTGRDSGSTDRTGPIDPDVLNPNDADVSLLIREWISVAKPPENAVPGSNWRYDSFGRVVGSGPGGRTTSTHGSVDYGGDTPESAAWSLRKQLDSIDHCTLEEYVVAKLENKSINHCAGRYGAVRDLKGLKLKEAKTVVTGAGFKPRIAPGSSAETPEAEGTIERQEPGPKQYLKKGQDLKIVVHTPYVPGKVTLPDFIGEPLGNAKKWLTKNKLKMNQAKAGSPAPSKEKSGTIEAQEPAPGTVMQAGGKVTLTVHSIYVDTRNVPRAVGLSAGKAKELIESAGLKADLKSGGKPSSRDQGGIVARQSPAAGESVSPGTEVAIFVYGPYMETTLVPDVRKLSYEEARRRLEAVGLSMSPKNAGRPDNRSLANTAQKQEPVSGTEVTKGQSVSIWFYSEYVPTREEQVANTDCSRYPGSRAYWDDTEGKPLCGCPKGLVWDSSQKTRCVPQLTPEEICARKWSGSVPMNRKADGNFDCGCPEGSAWAVDKTHCEKLITPDEVCARDFPGSIASGKTSDGKVNCVCPQGLRWNLNNSACVSQHDFAREWCNKNRPGSISVRKPDGGYECRCPEGYSWADNPRRCIEMQPKLTPEEVCARKWPGSIPMNIKADGNFDCGCPQGYVWAADKTHCEKLRTGGGGGDSSNQCEYQVSMIKSYMEAYRRGNSKDIYLKQTVDTLVSQARMIGCDQNKVNEALGTTGSGGGKRCVCPPGTVPSETFGQSGCINPSTGQKVPEICNGSGTDGGGGGGGGSQSNGYRAVTSCQDPRMKVIYQLILPYTNKRWPICVNELGKMWIQQDTSFSRVFTVNKGWRNPQGCYENSSASSTSGVLRGTLCGP